MADQATREEQIFTVALQFATREERAAYLKGACAGDTALLQRVEALLQAHQQVGISLDPDATVKSDPSPELPVVEPLTEKPGDRIGRYKLLQEIGEGGCGVVYMAEQQEPVRRRVALKVIKLGMDTKQVIARFEAERQALALMDHPNIAKVLDAGATEAGRPYFVMELVRGVPITEYCDQNNLSTRERLNLFIEICKAIQHAHQKGIIHRDIKPSNILVTLHDGVPVPKVIDFGIAKATSGQRLTDKTLFTAFEQFIGTPAYMSPEQAEMSGLDVDTRSDIYALGVLLYELLAGRTPFDAKRLVEAGIDEIRRIIREEEPPRPSTRISTLVVSEQTTLAKRRGSEPPKLIHMMRGDLDWIVMKAMEKDRTRRYDTANGLAMDIQRYLTSEAVVARPQGNLYRFQKLVRRNKLVFTAAGVVSGVLVLGVIVSTWQAIRATRARHEAVEARNHEKGLREAAQQAQANEAQMRERAEKQELEARQRAYASDMNVAKQALDENNLGRAQDLLDRQRPQPGQKDLRGWEWRYLWQQCRSDALFTLCQESSEIESLAVSQDGQWLAIGQFRGGVSVWDVRTRQELIRLAKGERYVRGAFSPAEPLLAFTASTSATNSNTLRLWNAATRQMIAELPLDAMCIGLAFAKDGRTLATSTSGTEGHLTVWRMPDGTKLVSYPAASITPATGFAAATDLSLAAYGLTGGRIGIMDLRNGKELWTAVVSKELVTALAFSPDGRILASAAGFAESDIRLWDVATGKEIGRLEGHGSYVSSMVFWPDGKTLASSGADQTSRIWDVASRKCLDVLRGHRQEVWRVAILPDDKTLVTGCKDGTVCFWDASVTHPRQPYFTMPEDTRYLWFTPDGQSVLTLSQQRQVSRWSGPDFQQKEVLREFGTNHFYGLDFPDDERLLALSSTNGVLEIWDVPRRQKEALPEFGTNWYGVAFSHDGRFLACGSTNGVLQIWDVSRRVRHLLTNTVEAVIPVNFLPDGNKLLTWSGTDKLYHEWNLTTGLEIQSWQPPTEASAFRFSPGGGSYVAIYDDGRAVLRNFADERDAKLDLDVPEGVDCSFSPDGKLFAVASTLGYARVWDTAAWREAATFGGFLNGVHSVAFSPDGKRLALGSGGKEAIKLYDMESHQEVLTLEGHGSEFSSSGFSPDGTLLYSVNHEGVWNLWRAPSWAEIEAATNGQANAQSP